MAYQVHVSILFNLSDKLHRLNYQNLEELHFVKLLTPLKLTESLPCYEMASAAYDLVLGLYGQVLIVVGGGWLLGWLLWEASSSFPVSDRANARQLQCQPATGQG